MSNIQSLNKDLYDKYDNRYIKRDEYSGGSAETTTYDNTDSGLTSTNVQGAIDELANKVKEYHPKVMTVTIDQSNSNPVLGKQPKETLENFPLAN